jgi:peroxiredoxin
MKNLVSILIICITLFSCNNDDVKGKFTISGEIKNTENQKVFLEELFFSNKQPEVLDTASLVNGKFSLSAIAPQQGLYRIRLEKDNTPYFFINDKSTINLAVDAKDSVNKWPNITTPANNLLKQFALHMDDFQKNIQGAQAKVEQDKMGKISDSVRKVNNDNFNAQTDRFKNFMVEYIDTTSNPVMALFALGYTQNVDPLLLEKSMAKLTTRFKGHTAIETIVAQYNSMVLKTKNKPQAGAVAPELTMNDTEGKSFSLSSLKGKYVLVDFWASWCGPCRGENPTVVAAYNKFKDKNFTILGVSLDDNKEAWLNAIAADKLTWKHISDLKRWNSAAIPLYNIDGIPYNVLLNPEGQIIASSLRGEMLMSKLEEVLK